MYMVNGKIGINYIIVIFNTLKAGDKILLLKHIRITIRVQGRSKTS